MPSASRRRQADHQPTAEDARRLTEAIAAQAGPGSVLRHAGLSRISGITWRKERALAVNVDPRDSKLEDPEERARLARVFERGLTQAVGYVLPVERSRARQLAFASIGRPAPAAVHLLPGDSAIGFRLPLNSLPYVPPQARNFVPPPDPFAPLPPLRAARRGAARAIATATGRKLPAAGRRRRYQPRSCAACPSRRCAPP